MGREKMVIKAKHRKLFPSTLALIALWDIFHFQFIARLSNFVLEVGTNAEKKKFDDQHLEGKI